MGLTTNEVDAMYSRTKDHGWVAAVMGPDKECVVLDFCDLIRHLAVLGKLYGLTPEDLHERLAEEMYDA